MQKLLNTYSYQNQPECYLLLVPDLGNDYGAVWTSVAQTNEPHNCAFDRGTKKVCLKSKLNRDAIRYSLVLQRV